MVRVKNYETASTRVKVIQRKLLAFFSGHVVYYRLATYYHVPVDVDFLSDEHTAGIIHEGSGLICACYSYFYSFCTK